MTKFRPPSWAEPEPGEDTIEICYTDGETTAELRLPLTWRVRRRLGFFVRRRGRHRRA